MRLPAILGGVDVSPLAYRLVEHALAAVDDLMADLERRAEPELTTGDVVRHYAERFGVDEADVLRALAELERAGVLRKAVLS